MRFEELKTEEEIRHVISSHWHADNDAFLPPVFHGTDASIFTILPQERKQIEEACDVLISFLVQLYAENSIVPYDKRLVNSRDERGNTGDALVKAQGRMNNSPLFSYEHFCVTNHPRRAIGYSQQSWICGETGWIAYRLLETAKDIGLVFPDNYQFNRSMDLINQRKLVADDPMVLILVDVDSLGICLESGTELKPNSNTDKLFHKISDIKNCNNIHSLRLGKNILENVDCVYAVKKLNYDKLLNAWNEMKHLV